MNPVHTLGPLRCLGMVLSLGSFFLFTSCTSSQPIKKPNHTHNNTNNPPSNNTTTPKTRNLQIGDVRLIHTVDWPSSWNQFILGIDEKSRHLFLRLELKRGQSKRFAIDTIDLQSGKQLSRWNARPKQASLLVKNYPQFHGLSGDFYRDLEKYAQILRKSGPWSQREARAPFGVTPDPNGALTLYSTAPTDGTDGDWLMLSKKSTRTSRRFDSGIRANYRPNFSPDGRTVAWIGGSSKYARSGKNVGYVLRLATLEGTPRAITQVRDVIRTPVWSADSSRLFALGTGGSRLQKCLFEVKIKGFQVRTLHCHEGALDFVLNPSGDRIMLLLHPRKADSVSPRTLVWLNPDKDRPLATYRIQKPQGMGAFATFIDDTHMVLFTEQGHKLIVMNADSGKRLHEIELKEEDGSISGRHTTKIIGDELILLRQNTKAVEVIGVKVR